MLLRLADSKPLADAISVISELVTEIRIKVNKAGLTAIAVDPANVALVALKLQHSAFTAFEAEEEELCVNLEDLKQILKRASPGSTLTLEKKGNKLNINIQNSVKRNFTLALINLETEEKRVPDLEFTSKVELNASMLQHAIEDAAIVADACSFEAGKNAFSVEAKGSLNSSLTQFSAEEAKFSGEGKAKYSLEYLGKFIKASKLADKVQLQFAADYPMRLDFKGNVELTFILAPRVEEEG